MPVESFSLRKDPWFIFAVAVGGSLLLAALIGPFLAPYDPYDISFTVLEAPTAQHWLGVNDGGMDIFSELLTALRNTIVFGLIAGLAGTIIAVLAGIFSALNRGFAGQMILRLADMLLAIPSIMPLVLLAALFQPPPYLMALTLALFLWSGPSRLINAQTRLLITAPHILAARQMGGSRWYLLRRHLLPEIYPLALIILASRLRAAMFMEASLAFLGLMDPSRKSLGSMIGYGLKYYFMDIWSNWLIPPIVCLSLLIMSATLLAMRMEKHMDPRLQNVS